VVPLLAKSLRSGAPSFLANNYSEWVRHLTGDQMNFLRHRHVPSILLLVALAGCTQQNPQDLKEKTARATEDVKRDARAVASGIREGWSRDKPLDLNAATKEQLLSLPGVTSGEADRVIAARPYDKASELVTRRIVRKAEYDKIADLVTVKK
jgi:DNA uptake protein ComE-like DNA-binding protein